MYKRAVALLELDRGSTFTKVAQIVGVTIQTASTWAQNTEKMGWNLTDKPVPVVPKRLMGLPIAQITALACSDAPEGYSQWSLRLLAEKVVELEYIDTISHTEIGRILKKRTQAPLEATVGNRQMTHAFLAAMERILWLYAQPYKSEASCRLL